MAFSRILIMASYRGLIVVCRFIFNFFGLLLGRPPFLRMTIVNSGARLMMYACKWLCHPLHLQLNPVQYSNRTEICRTGLIIRNITPDHVICVPTYAPRNFHNMGGLNLF